MTAEEITALRGGVPPDVTTPWEAAAYARILDELARQFSVRTADQGNWFWSFRGGLFGFYSRMNGLRWHSKLLHEWNENLFEVAHEHHISTMLFCMDSALECFVFMLNSLGQAADPAGFRNVFSESELRKISPVNLTGTAKQPPLSGYAKYFPQLQQFWIEKRELISTIQDHHDVTKHRQQSVHSGWARLDYPEEFFAKRGITLNQTDRLIYAPAREIRLTIDPKKPIEVPGRSEYRTLESIQADFEQFTYESFRFALADAQRTIRPRVLPEYPAGMEPTLHIAIVGLTTTPALGYIAQFQDGHWEIEGDHRRRTFATQQAAAEDLMNEVTRPPTRNVLVSVKGSETTESVWPQPDIEPGE